MSCSNNTASFRKALAERISRLGPVEHQQIYNRIVQFKGPKVDVSHNQNGAFLDLANLSDDLLADIDRFVCFCLDQQQELDKRRQQLLECCSSAMPTNAPVKLEDVVVVNNDKTKTSTTSKAKAASDAVRVERFLERARAPRGARAALAAVGSKSRAAGLVSAYKSAFRAFASGNRTSS
jgi:hypothetical protein